MPGVKAFLVQLWATARPADVLDVLVVSAFVYTAIAWFRRARSRFVMTGVAAITALYFVARVLDMYLTLFVLQAGVAVAVIALVVIFQEDIRRAFERIALAGRLGTGRRAPTSDGMVDTVVTAVATMAKQKTGALIVFRGREPLERHLTGGVPLDGQVSEPLLYSIFDHHSPGHDGAVIIEDGVLRRFAAHLPLSTRVKGNERYGTRHTAAIGLSERSDTFVVVVSEERGEISIARAGTLEVASVGRLESELSAFIGEITASVDGTPARRWLARDPGTKLVSLAITLVAWVLIFGYQGETVARTLTVPIVYRDVPAGWFLEQPKPLEASVTVSGSSRTFQLVDTAHLAVSLDVGELRPGAQMVEIREKDLGLPTGLIVHRIEPRSVTMVAWPTVPVELNVAAQLEGSLPHGLSARSVTVEPRKVKLLVPQSERPRYTTIHTEAIDLSSITQTTTIGRALVLPKDARATDDTPDKVQVTIEIAGTPR